MKTTLIFAIFSSIFFLTSCQQGNKVGQFEGVISGQPITIGYTNLVFTPGDTVCLHQYAGSGWAIADPDEVNNKDFIKAVYVMEVVNPVGPFAPNKVGQFKTTDGQFSVPYDPNLSLQEGKVVYLHEYSTGWGLAAPDDTTGTKVVFVK